MVLVLYHNTETSKSYWEKEEYEVACYSCKLSYVKVKMLNHKTSPGTIFN